MKKEKLMTVIITDDTHKKVKSFCDRRGLKIGRVVDEALKAYIGKSQEKIQ